jgi:hypothetical protein
MDLIRSCYTTFMRFFSDSDLAIKVRWFFCDNDAETFPGHHRFGSGNWASDKWPWPGAGEVPDAPRVWDSGAIIPGYLGEKFCGPLSGYRDGVPFPGVPLNGIATGECQCCKPLPPSTLCSDFVPTLPATLRFRILSIDVGTGIPSLYHVGDEFDMVAIGFPPDPTVGFYATQDWQRNGCPDLVSFHVVCTPGDQGNFLQWHVDPTLEVVAPDLVQLAPFRAYYSGMSITTPFCSIVGNTQEVWSLVLFDPAFPP